MSDTEARVRVLERDYLALLQTLRETQILLQQANQLINLLAQGAVQ